MNPNARLYEGWYCGLINDAAIVRHLADTEYYQLSRGQKRNVEIVPFSSVAPFQVGVTTRNVRKGEELFVSYGYNYWASALRQGSSMTKGGHEKEEQEIQNNDAVDEKRRAVIQQQEDRATVDIANAIQLVQENYAEAAEQLADLFEGLGPTPPVAALACCCCTDPDDDDDWYDWLEESKTTAARSSPSVFQMAKHRASDFRKKSDWIPMAVQSVLDAIRSNKIRQWLVDQQS